MVAILIQIVSCFVYMLLTWGMAALVLRKSDSYWKDLLYITLLAPCLVVTEYIWMVGWRTAVASHKVDVWQAETINVAVCFVAGIFCVWLYFGGKPNLATCIGLALVGLGTIIAALGK